MNNRVKISVFFIVACLLAIAAINGYRYFAYKNADKEEAERVFLPFSKPAAEQEEAKDDIVLHKVDFEDLDPQKLTTKGMVRPIIEHDPFQLSERIEDSALPTPAATRVQRTSSKQQFMDFQSSPAMQAFNSEMKRALQGKVSEADLQDPRVLTRLISDPQISQILLKYTKDPAFAEIMSNALKEQELLSSFAEENIAKTSKQE